MSHENGKAGHRQKCKLSAESIPHGCTIVVGKSSNSKVSLQKRKEEAKQTLYLNRV